MFTVISDNQVDYVNFFQELIKSPYNEFKLVIDKDNTFYGKFQIIDNKLKLFDIKFSLYYPQQDEGDLFVSTEDQYVLLNIDNQFFKVENTEDICLHSYHNKFIKQWFSDLFYGFFHFNNN